MAYAYVTYGYDGGGGWGARIPEREWANVRTVDDGNGKSHREALVAVSGDGGGSNYEWVRVTEDPKP